MAKLDKVINGLKCCTHAKAPIPCGDCSYFGNDDYNDAWSCRIALMRDALELLKEQEAVAVHDPGTYCPKCGWMLYPEDHPHHCGNCGQAVKWE